MAPRLSPVTLSPARPDWPTIMLLGVFHALAIPALFHFSWGAFAVFFAFYLITAGGITLGFHRYFTHRSFKAGKPLEYVMAVAGTLALQGSIWRWVAHHRMHHAFSDTDKDPHNARRGFWYSHFIWLLKSDPRFDDPIVMRKYARDIISDPVLRTLSKPMVFIGLQVILGLILWAIGGFWVMMWGIFARLVFVYHVTWLVNSAAHKWGYRNYEVNDLARNNWWVGLLALGEGWHNNHHAMGESARHGHRWWEFDSTWLVIKTLAAFGLVWDIKSPAKTARTSPSEVKETPEFPVVSLPPKVVAG